MVRRRRAAPARGRRRTSRSSSSARPERAPQESGLLELARALGEIARREPPPRALGLALDALQRAYAREPPRPRGRGQGGAGGVEAAALAVAWAREQVRVALGEILAGAVRAAAPGAPPESRARLEARAWLLLAAGEALAREPAGAGADRWRDALELIAGVARPD